MRRKWNIVSDTQTTNALLANPPRSKSERQLAREWKRSWLRLLPRTMFWHRGTDSDFMASDLATAAFDLPCILVFLNFPSIAFSFSILLCCVPPWRCLQQHLGSCTTTILLYFPFSVVSFFRPRNIVTLYSSTHWPETVFSVLAPARLLAFRITKSAVFHFGLIVITFFITTIWSFFLVASQRLEEPSSPFI